jgi:thioredoxin-dependent peroxiredoxin
LAKLEASNTQVLGISIDSPADNAAFAKSIGVTFPLLSDMNRESLTAYGVLKKYDVKGGKYEWARRTSFVVDKEGIIRRIDFDKEAINPNTAVTMCMNLHRKQQGGK